MIETLTEPNPSTHDPGLAGQDPELTESAEEIAAVVIGMVRQFSALRSRVTMGPEGETSPQFLLVKLAHFGPSRASELAERVCADPSTVSRQVAQLVKSGLVERRADPDDGRASILVPTDLGLVKVREHVRRRGEVLRPVVADWSPQDRADLIRLVKKYTEGIEAHREQLISGMLQHSKETS